MIRKVGIILAVAAAIRVFFILATPATWVAETAGLQAHNDEPSHINYVKYLVKNHSLPVQVHHVQEQDALIVNEFEYYQPPLAYIFCASFSVLVHVNPASSFFVPVCRIFNLILGLLSIVLFYQILIAAGCRMAVFYTLLFSLMPIHIRHSASFGNDMLAWVFCLLVFYTVIRRIAGIQNFEPLRNDHPNRGMLWEGVLIGLAVLSKSSLFSLIVLYGIVGLFQHSSRKQWLFPAFIGFLISAPYFIRNWLLYRELVGMELSCGPPLSGLSAMTPYAWFHFFRGLLVHFAFPYDTLPIPFLLKAPAYLFWAIMFIIAGFILLKRTGKALFTSKLSLEKTLGLFFCIVFSSMIFYNWHYVQTESRLVFHGLMALMVLFSVRFDQISHRMQWILTGGALYPLVLMLVFSVIIP